jgi:hypothetical protein
MDRREALKKLAIGGATVAGASVVISSPAFASGGSNGSQPGVAAPIVTLTKNPTSNDKAAGTVTISSRACPVGNVDPARLDYGITEFASSSLLSFAGAVTPYTTASGSSVADPISLEWSQQTNRSITIEVSARWVCREADNTNLAWSCGVWRYTFTANSGGTVSAALSNPSLINSTCPAPT